MEKEFYMKERFRGTTQVKRFYDRKVYRGTFTQTLAVGKILPPTWLYVRCKVLEKDSDSVTIQFIKLAEAPRNAHGSQAHQKRKRHA